MRTPAIPLLLALTLVGAAACADSPTTPAPAGRTAAFDQGPGGGNVSLGGDWSGTFTSVNGVSQIVTLSLNQSNGNQLSGHAFVAFASNPTAGVRDTVIGAFNDNLVALQFANENVGTFGVGYDGTASSLGNGGAQMAGVLTLLLSGEIIAPLTLTRP